MQSRPLLIEIRVPILQRSLFIETELENKWEIKSLRRKSLNSRRLWNLYTTSYLSQQSLLLWSTNGSTKECSSKINKAKHPIQSQEVSSTASSLKIKMITSASTSSLFLSRPLRGASLQLISLLVWTSLLTSQKVILKILLMPYATLTLIGPDPSKYLHLVNTLTRLLSTITVSTLME